MKYSFQTPFITSLQQDNLMKEVEQSQDNKDMTTASLQ